MINLTNTKKRIIFFSKSFDLLYLFEENFSNIKTNLAILNTRYNNLNFNFDKKPNKEYNFSPLISNYQTKHQLQNKYWRYTPIDSKTELSFENRQKELLNLIKEIDSTHISINEELNLNENLPILISVFPCIDPTTNKILNSQNSDITFKRIAKTVTLEQKSNYTYDISAENQAQAEFAMKIQLLFTKPKFNLIDGISYLHSSFTFSPIIRFPLLSKSIYKEWHFFNPQNKFFLSKKSKNKKMESIIKFGNQLEDILIFEDLKKYLQKRNGQILAISDLPIEWLSLNKIPLALTHDIARIQESNYQGNINNYSANNRLEFQIDQNILKKTLIILSADAIGSDDHEFKEFYKIVEEYSEELEFQFRYCRNCTEVSRAIKETNPYLLIFDCHGDIDEVNQTSYLLINNERIYGDDIIKHEISAPIVFLSCCNSNPNHGFLRKLHDAFFQSGAISITATFQPISIKRGTLYYIRMLNLLKLETNKKIFKNWLGFISHVIRSSIIHDVFDKANRKLNRPLTKNESIRLSEILLEIMIFEKRREVFKKLLADGIKISDELKINIEDTDSEMLMYTHYGRPDLIYFE